MEELFSTPLGEMRIIEYYLYYDRPFIFECEDKTQSKYIVHLVDDDDKSETYYLVPSSDFRIEAVRTGKISLRDSIVNSETLKLWEVQVPFDGSKGSVRLINTEDLGESDLPGPDAVLDLPDNRLPLKSTEVGIEAEQLFRDILYLYFNDGQHSQVMYADHLGAILLRSQNLVHSLVADYQGLTKGRIPNTVKDRGSLLFAGDFAASVGIKLEAKHNELLDSPFYQALDALLSLLDASTDRERLATVLADLNKRSIVRYRYFLQGLQLAKVNFKAEWGSPKQSTRTASLTNEQINKAVSFMDLEGEDIKQTINLVGDLVGLLINKKYTFEFISSEGERYRGKLSEELKNDIQNGLSIQVPAKNISIELEEIIEINQTTSEEIINYVLLKLN